MHSRGGLKAAAARLGAVFVGRETELAELERILAAVEPGSPRIVLVEGEPGMGKTTLVERFLERAACPRVVRAAGEETEALLQFGVLDQLLRVAGRPGVLGAPANDHVGVGMRVLEMLGELQSERPVAVVVDDLQWADAASLRALLFATRRLSVEAVLLLLVVREQAADALPEGLRKLVDGPSGTRLHLEPLAPADLRALASGAGVTLSTPAAQRLHEHTGGHPLYARALLGELPADTWDEGRTLPAPRTFAALVTQQLEACTPATRRVVEAAAVLGRRARLDLVRALAGADDASEAEGLLRRTREYLEFDHPLTQAAVYHALPADRRAELHRRAAEVIDDEGTALRHRVAAAPVPDPGLADVLEAFSEREARRGAWPSAAARIIDAGRLSETASERERRMVTAVELMVSAGEGAAARPLIEEAAPGPRRDLSLGLLTLTGPDSKAGEALLRRAWAHCDPEADPKLAAMIAYRAGFAAMRSLKGGETVEWGRRTTALAPDSWEGTVGRWITAEGLAADGRLDEARATLRASSADAGFPLRPTLAWFDFIAEEPDDVRPRLLEAANAGVRQGSIPLAAVALSRLSRVEFALGAWDDATLHADRALSLIPEHEDPSIRAMSRWAAIQVPAARGEWEVAAEHARALLASVSNAENHTAAVALGTATLAHARRDAEGVLRALDPIVRITPRESIDEPGFWPWQHLYAEALVACGRLDEAAAHLDAHEARARGHRTTRARLLRARGALEEARGATDPARAAFTAALEQLDGLPLPWDRALIELALGRHLRRHGSRRDAARLLRSAQTTLEGLGAVPELERSSRELDASGLVRRPRVDRDLTPQERAVAHLVASGMTNRQVAAELLVSTKTVEVHLTRIYAKLDVRSRGQMASRLRATPPPAPAPPDG